jgi:hypothetical protein
MAAPSVTGKTNCVSCIVCGVVDRLYRRKTRDTDEYDAEQYRGNAAADRVEMSRNAGSRLNKTGHVFTMFPPPEGRCGFGRRQVSWLAARRLFPTFPVST